MMVSFYLRSCYQLTQPPSWKTNPCLSSTAYTINSQLRGGAVDSGTALQVGRSRVRFPMVSLEFFIDIILPAALWPLTEMSTRNISWGVNAAGSYGWQPYHLHVSIVLKSGSLNLLESSGPVQACNGIALPLPYLPHWRPSFHPQTWGRARPWWHGPTYQVFLPNSEGKFLQCTSPSVQVV